MIEKMLKVYVVARSRDREGLLDALGELGVIHLTPLDPLRAVAEEKTVAAIDTTRRAIQILSDVECAGDMPDISAMEAADQALRIQRQSAEGHSRLAALGRQLDTLAVWGDARLDQFEMLRQAGVDVKFFSLDSEDAGDVRAQCVEVVAELPAKRSMVAVIRPEEDGLPESAEPLPVPKRDRPAIRAEAAEIDAALKRDAQELTRLAQTLPAIEALAVELARQADYTIAVRGGLAGDDLFAIQGWCPLEKALGVSAGLVAAGVGAAVQTFEPTDQDNPPTLIRYPRWAEPIKGLFEILGTFPGYNEFDLSGFFMIALPLFAAILIGDAGYGLVFLVLPLVFYRKLTVKAGKAKTHLLMVVGAATLVWGMLSANYFGLTPDTMALAGGHTRLVDGKTAPDVAAMLADGGGFATVGKAMVAVAPIYNTDAEASRTLLMKIAFLIGAIHLTLAQLRKALAQAPAAIALSSVGWAIFLWGMLGIIWYLMFIGVDNIDWTLCGLPLGIGYVLVLLFTSPNKNPFKRILIGFASSLLPALAAFSDTMSYVRLMAVGLASYYIAAAFNGLGATLADAATWFAAAPVIAFGHLLNMGLAVIAIFAHGVRLNMLEFSSNAGVQWAGHAYEPFTKQHVKET